MLKKALERGSAQQQASGLLSVVNTISGNNPQVAKLLARMLMKGGVDTGTSDAAPAVAPTMEASKTKAALKKRGERVDKTQAMKMLKQTLATKSATDQSNFVIDLLKSFDIKDAAKQRLFLKMRKELKNK